MGHISWKRILYKSSIFIPIVFICYIFSVPITIYIREINLYLGYGMTPFSLLVLSLLWLCCSPFRKGCCDGSWSELLFNLVPVECFLILVFAQWHFVIALFAGTATVSADIAFMLALRRDEQTFSVSEKRHRQNKAAAKRFSVFAAAVICAVPCFISFFVFDLKSPIYEAEQEILKQIFSREDPDTGEETDLFAAHEALMLCFWENVWKDYSVQEKITLLQELGDLEAQRLGIPSVPIKSEKLSTYMLGAYDWSTKEIWIDLEHLEESPIEDCITTICHEVFHSQQDYLVENIDWESEITQSEYFSEARAWRDNASNYQSAIATDYDTYAQQPLEASAAAYAEEETALILSYIPQ